MYSPVDWSNFVNEDYPRIVQIVNGESPANTSQALRRRSKDLVRRNPCVAWGSCTLATLTTTGNCSLVKRGSQPNNSPSYTSTAILCGDSVDLRGTTVEDVFKGIISTARNVSHICEPLFLSCHAFITVDLNFARSWLHVACLFLPVCFLARPIRREVRRPVQQEASEQDPGRLEHRQYFTEQ